MSKTATKKEILLIIDKCIKRKTEKKVVYYRVEKSTLHVTYSSYHRYFREILGMSPKQCFKALRFKTALKNYRTNGSYYLYDELGYTDFSHFVKEAKSLANKNPSEL